MATRVPAGGHGAALAPAGIGLALIVVVVEIRMDAPGPTASCSSSPRSPAVGAARCSGIGCRRVRLGASRPAATALLVAGLALVDPAIGRLGNVLAGDDFTAAGRTLTWMLALFTALAAFCCARTGASICLLIARAERGRAAARVRQLGLRRRGHRHVPRAARARVRRAVRSAAWRCPAATGRCSSPRRASLSSRATTRPCSRCSSRRATGSLGWGWELITLLEGGRARRLRGAAARARARLLRVLRAAAVRAARRRVVGGGGAGEFRSRRETRVFDEPSVSLIGWPLCSRRDRGRRAAGLRRQVAAKS